MKSIFTFLFCITSTLATQAQLWLDATSYTPDVMINDFFADSYVTISDVTYASGDSSMCFFDASATPLGMNSGLLLTTGHFNVAGANTTSSFSSDWSGAGDADLEALCGSFTYDASIIEFNFIPSIDTIKFKYVFASEEYTEFVGSFNDVFAFYISGPNPSGGTYTNYNIALVPGSTSIVSVNSINPTSNSSYYRGNESPADTCYTVCQYDGFTVPMYCSAIVVPGASYHLKIAIADANDGIWDSGVFLDTESLGGGFLRVGASPTATTIGSSVAFTGANKYATSFFWDFGDGTTSTLRNPSHTYATDLSVTSYNVMFVASNYCDSDTSYFTVGNAATNSISENATLAYIGNTIITNELMINPATSTTTTLQLYATNGQQVHASLLSSNSIIDTRNLSPGIYFAIIKAGANIQRIKLIKQ
jgi:hypothetical protein